MNQTDKMTTASSALKWLAAAIAIASMAWCSVRTNHLNYMKQRCDLEEQICRDKK